MNLSDGIRRSLIPLAVCLVAGILGVVFGGADGGTGNPGSGASVSASRVLVTESQIPACGAGDTAERDLVIVTAHMRRDAARSVDAIRITSGERSWSVRRSAGSCDISGPDGVPWREPCLVESCQADVCALRVPIAPPDRGGGSVEATYLSEGKALGLGTARYGPPSPGTAPTLSVSREGSILEVDAGEAPEGSGRVTLVREGRSLADAPLRYGAPGHARLTVPDGIDSVVVAVSTPEGASVRQSSVHLTGPFDGTCGPG